MENIIVAHLAQTPHLAVSRQSLIRAFGEDKRTEINAALRAGTASGVFSWVNGPSSTVYLTKHGKPTQTQTTSTAAQSHPTYREMVTAALKGLKERNGSSRPSIKKYIHANFKVGADADNRINQAIKMGETMGLWNWHKGPSSTLKPVAGAKASPSKKRAPVVYSPKKTLVPKKTAVPKKKSVPKFDIQVAVARALRKLTKGTHDDIAQFIRATYPNAPKYLEFPLDEELLMGVRGYSERYQAVSGTPRYRLILRPGVKSGDWYMLN
jgi:hypothetical protein